MKGSDLFLRCLEEQGVTTIFGVPGEENADLMISLLDSPIQFVVCRHEQGAAFMAEMYGRLTGKPGVCLATLGPGVTNLITGVASANMDHSPLVAIIGQGSSHRLHKESHQNMDSVSMLKPVTKWITTVRAADDIPEIINKAFKVASSEKQGACVIELPEDIAKMNTDQEVIPPSYSKHNAGFDEMLIYKTLDLIAESKAPVIIAGHGCVRGNASEALKRFVDATGIYAADTFMGKGSLSDKHERCLFTIGLGHRDIVTEALEAADLVICIGYDMVEYHPEKWNIGTRKKIIHIDTEVAEVDRKYVVDVDMRCDIAEVLEELAEKAGPQHRKDVPLFAEVRKKIVADFDTYKDDDSFPMKPQKILSDLRSVMRDEDILISDVGAHKIWVARNYPTYVPGTCLITNGFCSMGYALPGGISAKRLYPEKNVVALAGDGGFLMNVQDLATAARYKIPLTVLIWNDNGYGLISWKQQMNYCKTSHTELSNPDFVALAESFGCNGVEISSPGELKPALEKSFRETEKPTIIVVPVNYDENIELTRRMGQYKCDV